jgi:hypothetical protein
LHAALLQAEGDDVSQVGGRGDHGSRNVRLFRAFDLGGIGKIGRVVNERHLAPGRAGRPLERDAILHAGRGEHDGHLELALKAFLHDLQVQQTQKPATEPIAQRDGGVLLVDQGRVVELQLCHGLDELFIVVGIHGVDG